jgi:hypothetical protein
MPIGIITKGESMSKAVKDIAKKFEEIRSKNFTTKAEKAAYMTALCDHLGDSISQLAVAVSTNEDKSVDVKALPMICADFTNNSILQVTQKVGYFLSLVDNNISEDFN